MENYSYAVCWSVPELCYLLCIQRPSSVSCSSWFVLHYLFGESVALHSGAVGSQFPWCNSNCGTLRSSTYLIQNFRIYFAARLRNFSSAAVIMDLLFFVSLSKFQFHGGEWREMTCCIDYYPLIFPEVSVAWIPCSYAEQFNVKILIASTWLCKDNNGSHLK